LAIAVDLHFNGFQHRLSPCIGLQPKITIDARGRDGLFPNPGTPSLWVCTILSLPAVAAARFGAKVRMRSR
jgi:hypothetical protein